MKLPAPELVTSPKGRRLREWDVREVFAPTSKHWWTIHYRNRLNATLSAVERYVPRGGWLLDVGCAQGTAALLLAERGYHVVAVDADPECLDYARLRYESGDCAFVCLDATMGLSTLDGEFDGIVLGEVLEHVARPGALLSQCFDKLRPGGVVVATTPNGAAPHNRGFAAYDPNLHEAPERDTIPSGLGGRETHLLNFRMPELVEFVGSRGFLVKEHAFLESYLINPVGFHRVLPLGAARRIDSWWSHLPLVAQRSTLRLLVVGQKPHNSLVPPDSTQDNAASTAASRVSAVADTTPPTVAGERHLADLNVLIVGPGTPGSVLQHVASFVEQHHREPQVAFTFITHPLPESWSLVRRSEIVSSVGRQPRTTLSLTRRPSILGDLVTTTRVMVGIGRRFDLYIGAGLHLILFGLLLRKVGIVREVVGFSMDYWPRKYRLRPLNWLYHALDAYCATHADWTFNTSPAIPEARLKRGIGIDPQRQITVPHPIDRKTIGCLPRELVEPDSLVSSGLANGEYGFELIIEAMAQVVRKCPNAIVTVTGYGVFPANLRAQIEKRGLSRHFQFAGYIRDEGAFQQLLRSKRAGLAPYRPLTSTCKRFTDVSRPKVYMANGVPPIITPVPPLAAEIGAMKAGLVVEYESAALSDAILRLLTDDQLWESCRANAQELARRYETTSICARAFRRMGVATYSVPTSD